MALIHRAELSPTKPQLVAAWLPGRSWFAGLGDVADLTQVGAYRFDDPHGEVGIEALLLRCGDGPVVHVPLSYRAGPLEGARLVGTLEHSVLGRRWVYDGCTDPVWMSALAAALLGTGTQAEEMVEVGDHLEPRRPSVIVRSTGSPGSPAAGPDRPDLAGLALDSVDDGPLSVVRAAGLELVVVRVPGTGLELAPSLIGSWGDGESAVLAGVRPA